MLRGLTCGFAGIIEGIIFESSIAGAIEDAKTKGRADSARVNADLSGDDNCKDKAGVMREKGAGGWGRVGFIGVLRARKTRSE